MTRCEYIRQDLSSFIEEMEILGMLHEKAEYASYDVNDCTCGGFSISWKIDNHLLEFLG